MNKSVFDKCITIDGALNQRKNVSASKIIKTTGNQNIQPGYRVTTPSLSLICVIAPLKNVFGLTAQMIMKVQMMKFLCQYGCQTNHHG